MVRFDLSDSSSLPSSSSSEDEALGPLADLNPILRHHNIVDFEHVPADSPEAAPDGREDPDHDYDPVPDYVPHFTDILTLQEIIWQYQRPRGPPTSKFNACVPEPRVWHVLLSALKALSYLHEGRKLPVESNPALDDWNPIVQNGIHPGNIIFLHPMSKRSMNLEFRYGRCMVGNFERSVVLCPPGQFGPKNAETLTKDQKNRVTKRREDFEVLWIAGEKTGFEAPEIVGSEFLYDAMWKTEYPRPASDLWSLGAVAVAMMIGYSIWDLVLEIQFLDYVEAGVDGAVLVNHWRHAQIERRHGRLREYIKASRIMKALPRHYSGELRVIVQHLLNVNPWDRGSAPAILKLAEAHYEAWQAKGFRMWEADAMDALSDEVFDQSEMHRLSKAEKYLKNLR